MTPTPPPPVPYNPDYLHTHLCDVSQERAGGGECICALVAVLEDRLGQMRQNPDA